MKKLNPAYIEALLEKVYLIPYYNLTSMKIREVHWGQCTMEVAVQEKHFHQHDMVHGGLYASLVDAASYWAVFTRIDESSRLVSIDLKLNFLASTSDGYLVARGKSIKTGKTICMGEATIYSEKEKLLAHGTSTMMVLKDQENKGDFKLPSKFLDN